VPDKKMGMVMYMLLYTGGIYASTISEYLKNKNNSNYTSLGASGAVFGILIAFVYLFPNTHIYIYFLFPIKAKWLGILYFAFELYKALENSAGDNVARWAHVGGAIVGFVLVYLWKKKGNSYL